MLTEPDPGELDEVIDLIVVQQRTPDCNIAYLGTEVDGVTAELEDRTAWATTAPVEDHRGSARRLYEQLAFRPGTSFVGYRSWEQGIRRRGSGDSRCRSTTPARPAPRR